MASALDRFPESVRAEIARHQPGLRPDLLVIAEAEAAGWSVSFRDDNWHYAATFTRGAVVAWLTAGGWWTAEQVSDRLESRRQFEHGMAGVRAALGLPSLTPSNRGA